MPAYRATFSASRGAYRALRRQERFRLSPLLPRNGIYDTPAASAHHECGYFWRHYAQMTYFDYAIDRIMLYFYLFLYSLLVAAYAMMLH